MWKDAKAAPEINLACYTIESVRYPQQAHGNLDLEVFIAHARRFGERQVIGFIHRWRSA
jgi:hypothetical protein